MALLLLLTGCKGKKNPDITVSEALCPYALVHEGDELCVRLQSGELTQAVWTAPGEEQALCAVTQEKTKDAADSQYRVSGREEGLTQLQFAAAREDAPEEICFLLTVTVNVDDQGKVLVQTATHQEARTYTQGEDLAWNIDLQGVLTFRLLDKEQTWRLLGDGGEVCRITELMGMPTGWSFQAEPLSPGAAEAVLENSTTGRRITVQLQVDDNRKLSVTEVQG